MSALEDFKPKSYEIVLDSEWVQSIACLSNAFSRSRLDEFFDKAALDRIEIYSEEIYEKIKLEDDLEWKFRISDLQMNVGEELRHEIWAARGLGYLKASGYFAKGNHKLLRLSFIFLAIEYSGRLFSWMASVGEGRRKDVVSDIRRNNGRQSMQSKSTDRMKELVLKRLSAEVTEARWSKKEALQEIAENATQFIRESNSKMKEENMRTAIDRWLRTDANFKVSFGKLVDG